MIRGPVTIETLDETLAAFADGELDAARTIALWSFLEASPDRAGALRRVRELQQLSAAAKRCLSTDAPQDVRARIAALAATELPAAAEENDVRSRTVSIRPRTKRANYIFSVAAGLLIGIVSTAFLLRSASPRELLPLELLARTGRVHAACSRLPEALHDATFESVAPTLASTMQASLHGATAAPDLISAGFRFVGAGPCKGAGRETVHLLYRAANPRSVAAISVFVQPDAGQYAAIKAGRVYRVSSPSSPFPTLAWRKDQVVYLLLADGDAAESAVLQKIRPTSADEIVTVASR